ncbi:CBS domain-containing protein [Aquibacillus saliphilus]|uniref:CBS domain-containing protein n=1 Tax=Aquibacillus saliphilus TaxID=1909422 RepID=UPI001CEFE010|nr:CBS domain-containing protein [Aquibacillus saliphilus]
MEPVIHGENVHRFEAAYNRIHNKLIDLVFSSRRHVPYGEVLHQAKKLHNVVKYNYDILRQFGHLRNALVHRKIKNDFYIAEPHKEIVEEIETICELLYKPPMALSVASQPVTTYLTITPLKEILNKIKEKGFSQFPIYDDSGFQGLLTEGGIANWIACNLINNTISFEKVSALDVLKNEKKHNVRFLHRESTIYDLEGTFEASFDENLKLEAIIITETGSIKQKPIGIVTSWDLVKIDHTTISIASHV